MGRQSRLLGTVGWMGTAACLLGQTFAPQDNWFWDGQSWKIPGIGITSIAIDNAGHVHVGGRAGGGLGPLSISVYDLIGQPIRVWTPTNTTGPGPIVGLGFHPATNRVAVAFGSQSWIRVYDGNGNVLRSWDGSGSGAILKLSALQTTAIDVSPEGLIYVADFVNFRVVVFDFEGNYVRHWGGQGSLNHQFFTSPCAVRVGRDGAIYVKTAGSLIKVFTPQGAWLRNIANAGTGYSFAFTPDGMGVLSRAGVSLTLVPDSATNGVTVTGFATADTGLAVSAGGALVAVAAGSTNEIRVYERSYRTMGARPLNRLPQPVLLRADPRPGTTLLDIEFEVRDSDDPTVEVYALGFAEGLTRLDAVIPVNTLEEGTAVVLGTNVAANVRHRLVWNIGVDWAVQVGKVKIEILAKDRRGLMGHHFLNIPAHQGQPAFRIDRSPLTETDFFNFWLWWIAQGDPALRLTDGNLYGVGGAFDDQLLVVSGPGGGMPGGMPFTTPSGRDFIFSRLNVREATPGELDRAKQGTTPGTVTRWASYATGTGVPAFVNEFGFDTTLLTDMVTVPGDAWWVVPLEP